MARDEEEVDSVFDLHKYPTVVVECCEVMAAFYVNIFYNQLYQNGHELHLQQQVTGLTDGYIHMLHIFKRQISDITFFKDVLNRLYEYYCRVYNPYLRFTDFTLEIAKIFIPDMYHKDFSHHKSEQLLFSTLVKILKQFVDLIIKDYIPFIIDNHTDKDKPPVLQKEFIKCILVEKYDREHKILSMNNKTPGGESRDLVIKLDSQIKKMLKDLRDKNTEIKTRDAVIIKQNQKVKELENKITQLENNVQQLRNFITLQKSNNTQTVDKDVVIEDNEENDVEESEDENNGVQEFDSVDVKFNPTGNKYLDDFEVAHQELQKEYPKEYSKESNILQKELQKEYPKEYPKESNILQKELQQEYPKKNQNFKEKPNFSQIIPEKIDISIVPKKEELIGEDDVLLSDEDELQFTSNNMEYIE